MKNGGRRKDFRDPVTQILQSHKVTNSGTKEDLCDREADLLSGSDKGALSVDGYH